MAHTYKVAKANGNGPLRRGIGMAIVMQASGIPGVDMGAASIKMNEDGSFNLLMGATDIGTGVGLAVSRGIVEAHGGKLQLLPTERGATFEIRLPLGEGATVPPAGNGAQAEPAAPVAHRRALVVDDEADIVAILSEILLRDGFSCDVAGSGREARALIERARAERLRYDAVLCDLRQLGGLELALAVDLDVELPAGGGLELQPRAAVGDDLGVEQQPAGGRVVDRGVVHAGRADELADDHALGAVDDERAAVGDERELAEVDLLLDHVLVPLDAVDLLARHQAQPRLERRGIREIALDALVHRVLRLADLVRDELELEQLAGVADGEHPAEDLLQALVPAPQGVHVHLEEVAEALELDFEQVGNPQIPLAVDLREALPILPACSLQGCRLSR